MTAGGTADAVWRALQKATFAVLSHVTPDGSPRGSGVVFAAEGHRLWVVTAKDSWKARQISDGDEVAVTVPIRRGGLLTMVAPIPPATISFRARVTVHPAGSVPLASVSKRLAGMVPPERERGVVLELEPRGAFLTYGLGVSLREMATPSSALAHVPIG